LKSYVYRRVNLRALKLIADLVFRVNLPLSFLGRIRYGNGIDIKKVGLLPIVQLIKSLSIKAKAYGETTVERIGELIKKGVLAYEEGSELREAYQFLSIIRLRHQFQQFFEGKPLDNNIVKNELTHFEQQLLKASFQTINNMKQIFIRNFGQSDSVM
jgi:CBS domain-containing protein